MTAPVSPPLSRARKPRRLRVVDSVPPGIAGVEITGQGQRLFQLFRDDAMRAFCAPSVTDQPQKEHSHG